jgi:hypothetical protein
MSSPVPGSAPSGPLLPAGNPRIAGMINITEESFTDGGRYLDPAAALACARKLHAHGADVIELGSAPATWAPRRSLPRRSSATCPCPGAARNGRDPRLGELVPARDPAVRHLGRRGLPQRVSPSAPATASGDAPARIAPWIAIGIDEAAWRVRT